MGLGLCVALKAHTDEKSLIMTPNKHIPCHASRTFLRAEKQVFCPVFVTHERAQHRSSILQRPLEARLEIQSCDVSPWFLPFGVFARHRHYKLQTSSKFKFRGQNH